MNDTPTDNELSTLARLGEELYEAESEVLRLEAELKQAKVRRDRIQRDLIPEAMSEIGVLEFRTANSKISVKEMLEVRPLVDNRPLVLKALEEQGAGALIKTTLSVPFNRGEDEAVKQACEILQQQGRQFKQERKVEPQTLKKHVRDRLKDGKPVDMELFGVSQFKKAIFEDGAPEAPIFDEE